MHNVVESGSVIHKMKGSTKLEREMYEQLIILRKYGGELSKRDEVKYLLNRVNPVGGRYNLKSPKGLQEFYRKAEEIADKYSLPKNFN